MPAYQPASKQPVAEEETKDEPEDEEEPDDPRFNTLIFYDEFTLKKSEADNKVICEEHHEFELLKKIGQGAFCTVYKAIGTYLSMEVSDDGVNLLKIPYAVKVFDRVGLKKKQAPATSLKPGPKGFQTLYDLFEEETRISGRLKNPYINKAFFLHEDLNQKNTYLTMQFADHGNLGELHEDFTFHINPRVLAKLTANI